MRRSPKSGIIELLCMAAFLHAVPCSPSGVCTGSSTLGLEVNGCQVEAEVAATKESRARGLMFRGELPADHGMLFIFPEAQAHCMWMKNTRIPLSAAFLASDGTIVNIAEMEPGSTEYYCASKPIRHVLEMTQGWFRKMGIGAGARITGLDKAPAGQ